MTTATIPLAWRLGDHRIHLRQHQLQKLIDILELIRLAEEKHDELMDYSRGPFCDAFPEQKGKALREAKSKRAAAIRLQKYFTNCNNDFSL